MPYLSSWWNEPQDEGRKPTSSTGGPGEASAGGAGGGGVAPTQSQPVGGPGQAEGQFGTGFTNLQNYMGANQGANDAFQGQVAAGAGQQIGKASQDFQDYSGARDTWDTNKKAFDTGVSDQSTAKDWLTKNANQQSETQLISRDTLKAHGGLGVSGLNDPRLQQSVDAYNKEHKAGPAWAVNMITNPYWQEYQDYLTKSTTLPPDPGAAPEMAGSVPGGRSEMRSLADPNNTAATVNRYAGQGYNPSYGSFDAAMMGPSPFAGLQSSYPGLYGQLQKPK